MTLINQDLSGPSTLSTAGLLEKIEILRSALRWASRLERNDIEKLLRQANALRDEVVQLSTKERFVTAAAGAGTSTRALPAGERRRALLARSFVFEGTFGDNPDLLDALEVAEKA